MQLDKLLQEANNGGVKVQFVDMPLTMKGLYGGRLIWLNKNLSTRSELACAIAEEIGHHHTTVGNILDQSVAKNRKQERRAREWGHNRLIPPARFVEAYQAQVKGRHETAEFLGVTEQFLQEAINRYIDKYGLFFVVDERYTVCFEPLSVIERFIEN